MTKTIVTNPERCLGCKTCVIECSMAHTTAGTIAKALSKKKPPESRIFVESFGGVGVPVQCFHCEDAPCVLVCPTHAIHRDAEGGPVLMDNKLCCGCRQCLLVCPYGLIDTSQHEPAVLKCDQCAERAEAGQEPACVASCPTDALRFEDVIEPEPAVRLRVVDDTTLEAKPRTVRMPRDEFVILANKQELPAFLKNAVTTFFIDQEQCNACGRCRKTCPVNGITGEKKVPHVIDQQQCIRCGQCDANCRFDSVDRIVDAEMELVLCNVCSVPFTTVAELEVARSKLGEDATLNAICPLCRRSQTVERLAETCEATKPMGCV